VAVSPRELDVLGARAWPPLEEIVLDGWRLRFAGGVTKRANSVLPLGREDASPLAERALSERVVVVEQAYAERGLPACFQITASSWPPGLAGALSQRGYVELDPTLVMSASLEDLGQPRTPPGWQIALRPESSEAWVDAWWTVDGRGGAAEAEVARRILGRIALPRGFVEAHDADGLAGVGLGVLDAEWVGVYCMATLPRARRRGCARALVGGLVEWASANGARFAHLAVTEANEPAQSLYRDLGFWLRQRYSYLIRRG